MKRLAFALPLASIALFGIACSSDSGGDDDDDDVSPDAGFVGDVFYYQDIKPIVDAKCVRCHVADGIAPFALTDYDLVSAHGGVSSLAIAEGIMPPWKAEPGCNDYTGNFDLTAEEEAKFHAWVDQGMPEGDPALEGDPVIVQDTRLSRVDLTMTMPQTYAPVQEPDDYRCFLIPWPEEYTTTKYVSGFKAVPGNDAIVHHVIAYYATPDQVQAYYDLDDGEAGPGYTCFGGPRGPSQTWIGGWAPGGEGFDMPPGTGMAIEPGSMVILQVHYNTLYDESSDDQTAIQLKIDDSVDREVWTQPWANPSWLSGGMPIPAGDDEVAHAWQFDMTWINSNQPLTIYSAGLHMHNLGTRGLLQVNRSNGDEECLLRIDDWDFDWQDGYGFQTPIRFDPGDQMYLECHWDNSPENQVVVDGEPLPPQNVNWGDGSTDEMCLGVFLVSNAQ